MSTESLVPVAAIVDLILGIVTIALVRRSPEKQWVERLGGLLIGWILLVKGLEYTCWAVMETIAQSNVWFNNIGVDLENSFFRYARSTFRTIAILLVSTLPFVYPYPVIQRNWNIKLITSFVAFFSIILCTLWLLTDFKHTDVEWFLVIPGVFILCSVYIRFMISEIKEDEATDRRMSMVAGLLMIAVLGEQMTYWLAQVISINGDFIARFTIEWGLWNPSPISWIGVNLVLTMGAGTIMILMAMESWRIYHRGLSGFSIIVYLVGIVGFIAGVVDYAVLDIVRTCVETACETLPSSFDLWYDFTSETLVFLFTPLIFMYILLNFDIIDSQANENRWLTRIMVILMLLIVSSSVIELMQSFLPLPQMISSAALAMVVAIFIGWEERIMTNLMREGDTVTTKLAGMGELATFEIDDSDYDILSFTMSGVIFFTMIICLLYSSVG